MTTKDSGEGRWEERLALLQSYEATTWGTIEEFIKSLLLSERAKMLGDMEIPMSKLLKKHTCRFNDGDCVCKCFATALAEIKSIIEKMR